MVDFKKLADKAKQSVEEGVDKAKEQVEKRGGSDGLKQDAGELKDIAKGKGSIKEKAKAAGEAIKEPGAEGEDADAEAPRE